MVSSSSFLPLGFPLFSHHVNKRRTISMTGLINLNRDGIETGLVSTRHEGDKKTSLFLSP